MSEANKGKGKKRSKAYYMKCAKQHRRNAMEAGQKGFLVTCNIREKQCVREAYAILNEYANKLYGPEKLLEKQSDDEQSGEDIEDTIKKEVQILKTTCGERRFQVVDSGAKNCIFIKTQLGDPGHLVHTIFTDIQKTQKQCSRYILRLLPVNSICKAYLEDIKKAAEDLFKIYFQDTGPEGKTFAIIFKVRNNSTLGRNEIIPALASIIHRLNKENKADLKSPQLAVAVNIIGKCCCLAVLPEYYQLKKYNLMELTDKTKTEVIVSEEVQADLIAGDVKEDKNKLCDANDGDAETVDKDEQSESIDEVTVSETLAQ